MNVCCIYGSPYINETEWMKKKKETTEQKNIVHNSQFRITMLFNTITAYLVSLSCSFWYSHDMGLDFNTFNILFTTFFSAYVCIFEPYAVLLGEQLRMGFTEHILSLCQRLMPLNTEHIRVTMWYVNYFLIDVFKSSFDMLNLNFVFSAHRHQTSDIHRTHTYVCPTWRKTRNWK